MKSSNIKLHDFVYFNDPVYATRTIGQVISKPYRIGDTYGSYVVTLLDEHNDTRHLLLKKITKKLTPQEVTQYKEKQLLNKIHFLEKRQVFYKRTLKQKIPNWSTYEQK